jgi:hypothetical protein
MTTDDTNVKKAKSRKDQRHDQRVKEDEIRKVTSKEQPTNIKKDRKVSRELNAVLKVSNFLDAREKRLAELKYLLEIEDDEHERVVIKSEIKSLIRNPPPVEIVVEDSDEEVIVLPKIPSSATCSEITSKNDTLLSPPQQTELWGDDAPSEFGGDLDEIVDRQECGGDYNHEDSEEDQQTPTDSDTERSLSTTASFPPEVPTRVSPRKHGVKPAAASLTSSSSSSGASSSSAASSLPAAALLTPSSPEGECLFTAMTRTRGGSKKRKLTKK